MSAPAPDSPPSESPALVLRDVHFAYDDGPALLASTTFSVARAESCLITGPSGCGKSTLLHLIAGLIPPSRGAVEVDGVDLVPLSAARRDEWRGRCIGMIFQTFHLLSGFSALENVMLALVVSDVPESEHQERAHTLLRELGIERVNAEPDALSVGQKQRVAVARALATRPALVLADEPTASLDPEAAARAMDLIQSACRDHGAALVCTSHDPAMTTRFDRVESFADLSGKAVTA